MKRFIIGLLAVAGLAGAGYTTYADGKAEGRAELAWASPSDDIDEPVLLAQADVPDAGTAPAADVGGAGFGPAAATVGIAPTVATGPCIDSDGPGGPAPCISNPLDYPRESFDMAIAAKKLGWPIAVGVGLFFLLVLGAHLVPWLGVGKRALIISGATAVLAACGNTAFEGGTAWAIAFAGAGVLLKLVQGDRTVAALIAKTKGGV